MSWDFDDPAAVSGTPSQSGTGAGANSEAFEWPSMDQPTAATGASWNVDAETGANWFEDGVLDPEGVQARPTALPAGKPPMAWIAGAAAVAALALAGGLVAAFVLDGSLPLAGLCWLLAGPIAVLLLGQFVKLDERQRARASYEGEWARSATIGVGVLALLGVTVSAYVIADWVATR